MSSPSPARFSRRQTQPLTLFRVRGQRVKPSTFLLCTSQGQWESSISSLTTTLGACKLKFTQVLTWPEIIWRRITGFVRDTSGRTRLLRQNRIFKLNETLFFFFISLPLLNPGFVHFHLWILATERCSPAAPTWHRHTLSKVNRNSRFLQPAKLLCGLLDLVFKVAAAEHPRAGFDQNGGRLTKRNKLQEQ